MTDNEIIKALENEIRLAEYVDSDYCDGVDLTLIESTVALINCQKTEIDELKGISVSPPKDPMDFCGVLCDYAEELIDKAKAEAYKEFAERLKEEAQMADCFDSYNMVVGTHFINSLLKEMIDE